MIRPNVPIVLALFPSPALAEVCDKERPDWSRADGPATAFDELQFYLTHPLVWMLIALSSAVLFAKRKWLRVLPALLWVALASVLVLDNYGPVLDDVRWAAIQEGCLGSPHLFIALAIAICAGMTYSALRSRHSGEK